MAVTLSKAQTNLDLWIQASEALAKGREFSMGDRSLTMSDAGDVRDMITYWERKVAGLSGSKGYSVATWKTA